MSGFIQSLCGACPEQNRRVQIVQAVVGVDSARLFDREKSLRKNDAARELLLLARPRLVHASQAGCSRSTSG
jgi:hypothetical protein